MHNGLFVMMCDVFIARTSLQPLKQNANNHIISTNLMPLQGDDTMMRGNPTVKQKICKYDPFSMAITYMSNISYNVV